MGRYDGGRTHRTEDFPRQLTGKALKHEKVIEARLDEIKALQDMDVWEVVLVAECMRKTQTRAMIR